MSGWRGTAFASVAVFGAIAGALWGAAPAKAAELLVFEQPGCVWCQRFDREIAPIYPETEEGRVAPLRRLDLGDDDAALATLAAPVRYTPTFVLVENGREVGRIPGYAGEEAFWGLLAELTKKLPRTP
ncbi:thioredoxin family protein [Ancylobacter radicis]|uniref:Thioredoxin family protein n=1 Tax=Ancylobacter radicis TaxID=2836179 RepID=A0ABS5RBI2_9HYPH|nr:thioredoxin family protein [Ancylobacter radicis]MBS9479016.1 thioredoxin family protein [Ancylobacter radicis]